MSDNTTRTDTTAGRLQGSTSAAESGTAGVPAGKDTPPASPSRSSSSAPTGGEGSSAHGTRPVKPNIDPGRISKKPPTATPAAAPAPAAPDTPSTAAGQQGQPVQYDAKTNTVTFQLIGGPTGFQFNGHASGSATLTLPPKANVVINFINKDGTPHSAEVIPSDGPIPNSGGDPAIPRAYTNQLLQGLPQEGTDVMRFTVPASGSYRIFCGVPGHGLSGMWIWMKVDPAAKTPSFGPTKS